LVVNPSHGVAGESQLGYGVRRDPRPSAFPQIQIAFACRIAALSDISLGVFLTRPQSRLFR
jgi:hypothetical protein